MSGKRVYLGVVTIMVVGLVALGFKSGVAGQQGGALVAASAQNETHAKPVASAAPSRPAGSAAAPSPAGNPPSAFASAALRNAQLQSSLAWVFGGKTQRGWQLYVPLISATLGTDEDASTGDFALALSRWQKERGLEGHGILDDGTWASMTSAWQSVRIKERTSPPADQMVTAPAEMFFDPSRPEELRRVERRAYEAYRRMVAAAIADPSLGLDATADGQLAPSEKYLKIISAHRSREYQDRLRQQSPNSGRAGLAVNSPHFTGRALDIYVGGEPVSTKDENRAIQVKTPVYRWLVKNAARFGFKPYFYEPWHWEYVGEGEASSR